MDFESLATAFADSPLAIATWEHVRIAATGVAIAAAISVPLGLWIGGRRRALVRSTIALVDAAVAIPGLALLAMFAASGVANAGHWFVAAAAIPALMRNVIAATRAVTEDLLEVAEALGLRPAFRIRHVDIALGMPAIARGFRDASVAAVAAATLAALTDGGGYGEIILRGLSEHDASATVSGALASTVLALVTYALLGLVVRAATPRGLREIGRDHVSTPR